MSLVTGVNQVYLFGGRFIAAEIALSLVWLLLFLRRILTEPWRDLLLSLPMQLVLLGAVAVAAIPQRIDLLVYIAHRASLLVAVLVCAALAAGRLRGWGRAGRGWGRAAAGVLAVLFFQLLFLHTR